MPSDAETRHNALSDTGAFVAYSGLKTGYISCEYLVGYHKPNLS